MARLVGFIANRPDLCNRFAAHEADALSAHNEDSSPWGWGVGFFQAGEILLKRRPLDERRELAVVDMIEDVRSDSLLVHVRRATVGALTTANTHPFRYRQWIFADTGTVDGFGELSSRLLETLPKFLQRAVRGDTDSELVFHLFLSFLHDAGKLETPVVPLEDCGRALKASLTMLDRMGSEAELPASRLNILLATPDYLLAVRRGAPMGYRVLAGREDFEPLYDANGPEKMRMPALEPCRLAVVASDFDDAELPEGWHEVQQNTVMALSRKGDPQTIITL